jgi:two-component system, OmpR family, KDP operon response regulator KdpE
MADACLLIVEDEESMLRFLRNALRVHPFKLVEATSGKDGLTQETLHNPELMLLDLGLPDMDGLEVLKQYRSWSKSPVIILSARGQEQDKIRGLDSGADDYLTKPFSVGELLARIRACLRRNALAGQDSGEPVFQTGDLRVDLVNRQVFVKEKEIRLTPIEYKLLVEFVRHAGKVLTHQHLLKEVWNTRNDWQTHYVRIFVHQLRQKIEENSARPRYLLSEPGVGYRFKGS